MVLREDWIELPIDGQESIDLSSGTLTAKRKFRGPWDDRFQFLAGFIPTIEPINGSSFDYNLYTYPDMPSCVVKSAQITGKLVPDKLGSDEQISYDRAEIEINYESDANNIFLTTGAFGGSPPNADDVPVTRCSYSVKSVVELIKFDGKNVKKKGTGLKQHDSGSFNYPLRKTEIEITYLDTTAPSLNSALNNCGCMNTSALLLLDIQDYLSTFDAFTLLYEGVVGNTKLQLKDINSRIPVLTWEITHKFTHNRHRWDRIPIGCEPQNVAQANASPINLLFNDICLYDPSPDNFAFLRRYAIG